MPHVGDAWTLEDYRISVAKMDGPRVLMVRVEPKLSPTAQPAMTPPNPRPSSPTS